MNRPRTVLTLMAFFGVMMWLSLPLVARAADDAKPTGEKKDTKSAPSKPETTKKSDATKLEGKEAPELDQPALNAIGAGDPIGDFKLSSFRDKATMVLAFFTAPQDNDSVNELHELRDLMSQFTDNHASIVGISNYPLYKEKRLINREKLNFPIMGDESGDTCRKYGVIENGKVSRVTFIVDKKGIVRKVIETKDPKKHAQEALDYVKSLKS